MKFPHKKPFYRNASQQVSSQSSGYPSPSVEPDFVVVWGRCDKCRYKLRDFRARCTFSDGTVTWLCFVCASRVRFS